LLVADTLSEWLALREASDHASRSEPLLRRITERLTADRPVRVLDLCTGTGSNLRYLMERLPPRQHWLAVDRDRSLLEEIPSRLEVWGRTRGHAVHAGERETQVAGREVSAVVETRQMDLRQLAPSVFDGRHLVTASALLDLVSDSWLETLAMRCRAVGAFALFTIIYDGRSWCEPVEPEDEHVRELFNRHQASDKGLGGPAAGPHAAAAAEQRFAEAGYTVESARSDWRLTPDALAMQRYLIEGWAGAAAEVAPEEAPGLADWLRRRLAHVEAGRSLIVVGHRDVAAWL
jgi:hypothetical protein